MKKNISVEELKMLQLKILDSIDDFCKKNEIQNFLFSGTLIGAVRHKGYIPWDDDVDICMKRKDYDRFFAEFNQQRQDTLKAISTETEKDYYLASGKVIDTATVIEEENNYAMPIGVYVDVFPHPWNKKTYHSPFPQAQRREHAGNSSNCHYCQ